MCISTSELTCWINSISVQPYRTVTVKNIRLTGFGLLDALAKKINLKRFIIYYFKVHKIQLRYKVSWSVVIIVKEHGIIWICRCTLVFNFNFSFNFFWLLQIVQKSKIISQELDFRYWYQIEEEISSWKKNWFSSRSVHDSTGTSSSRVDFRKIWMKRVKFVVARFPFKKQDRFTTCCIC